MAPLLGQIVRLTKSILLRPLEPQRRPSAQFIAGKHRSLGFPSGFVLSWWYSGDTFNAIEAVVQLMTERSFEFKDCDPESVAEVVTKTLQEACLEERIFNVDEVCFARKQTLFECHAGTVRDFASSILDAAEENLRLLICRRCTLYTVPRFKVSSFSLDNDTIHVIAKGDRIAWQRLIDKGYNFGGWTPENPKLGARDNRAFAPLSDFECVLVAEEVGTQKGAKFSSVLRFRKLTSVIFSVASQRALYLYHKAMARPSEFCVQFPHQSVAGGTVTRSDCGALIPYYSSNIVIGSVEVADIRNWYELCATCNQDAQQRIEKGAHFLNRALNSDDIESYINFFIVLDALFGERGAVEASILRGVRALGIDPKFLEKASWLFDLRSELVHGGSRYITEWSRYTRYTQHFRAKPLSDIRSLAQLAVLNAPRTLT